MTRLSSDRAELTARGGDRGDRSYAVTAVASREVRTGVKYVEECSKTSGES